MKNIIWHRALTRIFDLQKSIQFAHGIGHDFKKVFSINGINNQLYFFDGRSTETYFSKKDFNNFLKLFKKKFNNLEFVTNHYNKTLLVCKKSLKKAKKKYRANYCKSIKKKHFIVAY